MKIRREVFNMEEVFLVAGAAVAQGPKGGLVEQFSAPGAGPFLSLKLQGFVPVDIEDGKLAVEGMAELVSILPLICAAQIYGTISEAVKAWPQEQQTRFHALTDQYLSSYRTALREQEEGKS